MKNISEIFPGYRHRSRAVVDRLSAFLSHPDHRSQRRRLRSLDGLRAHVSGTDGVPLLSLSRQSEILCGLFGNCHFYFRPELTGWAHCPHGPSGRHGLCFSLPEGFAFAFRNAPELPSLEAAADAGEIQGLRQLETKGKTKRRRFLD